MTNDTFEEKSTLTRNQELVWVTVYFFLVITHTHMREERHALTCVYFNLTLLLMRHWVVTELFLYPSPFKAQVCSNTFRTKDKCSTHPLVTHSSKSVGKLNIPLFSIHNIFGAFNFLLQPNVFKCSVLFDSQFFSELDFTWWQNLIELNWTTISTIEFYYQAFNVLWQDKIAQYEQEFEYSSILIKIWAESNFKRVKVVGCFAYEVFR